MTSTYQQPGGYCCIILSNPVLLRGPGSNPCETWPFFCFISLDIHYYKNFLPTNLMCGVNFNFHSSVFFILCFQPCAFDPLVDDSIVMARRLHKLNKSVSVHPMTDLCHGFLNFFTVSHRARQASEKCVEIMKSVIDKE